MSKVDEVWSIAPEAKAEAQGWYWMQHDMVRQRINVLISGNANVDAYGRFDAFLHENEIARPLSATVSLGCGFGGLERDLCRRGIVGRIDAYDLSEGAIAEARRLAAAGGFDAIRYHVADLDLQALPEASFDAIFAHSSVHHVEKLESLFENVCRALKPDGIFHLNEFVGATRFQWTAIQLDLINSFLESLPDRLRQTPQGPQSPVQRPTIEQMIAMDPTEAIRSADIRDALGARFEIIEDRPFGGTLLHLGLAGIAQNFDPANPDDVAHLKRFFVLEDRMIANGAIGSDFAVLTAVPRGSRLASRQQSANVLPSVRNLRPSIKPDLSSINMTVSRDDTMLASSDDHYISVGLSALSIVERALKGTIPGSILDLPCGFGRVTRVLRARYPNSKITVSDLDEAGINFSARQFSASPAYSVRDFRDLNLGERYDLIWVGSLATHLPALQTKRLLSAFARHLTPSGTLLVTVHGPDTIPIMRQEGYGLRPQAAAKVIDEFERLGYGYQSYVDDPSTYGVSMSNSDYGISLTAEPWLRSALSEAGLRLDVYERKAWDNHHDVAVARLQ